MWKKKIALPCGIFSGCYIIWSFKDVMLHRTHCDSQEKLSKKENVSNGSILNNFDEYTYMDGESIWLPNIQNSYKTYWNLLMLAKSKKQSVRHRSVRLLSELANLERWQYMMIAQASDLYTTLGLARSPNANAAFFLKPPFKILDTENSREEMFQLLLSLSLLDTDICNKMLVERAKNIVQLLFKKEEVWNSEFEESYKIYHTERKKKASVIFDKLCLQALLGYSSKKSHRALMFERGILKMLLSVLKLHEHEPEFQSIIAQILSNLALEEKFANAMHVTGWIGILAMWAKSPCVEVSLPAMKALANLDKDDFHHAFYDSGIYLLHPLTRTGKKEFCADIIFVHGLLGATFWTWRQHDSMKKISKEQLKKGSNLNLTEKDILQGNYCSSHLYTFCWPKDWLAMDFPDARFISVDYRTCISKWKADCPEQEEKDSLDAKAKYLTDKLLLSNIGDRPIIWITHSMGGLLVKQILTQAAGSSERKTNLIAQKTIGLIFFSVPHKGSDLAKLFQSVPYILQPSIDMEQLQKGSLKLLTLHEKFQNYVLENNISVLSFGELKKSKWGLTSSMLVTEDSSDPGIGEYYTVPVDHLSTCKPESTDSKVYIKTVEFLNSCIPQSSDMFQKFSKLELEISNILCFF